MKPNQIIIPALVALFLLFSGALFFLASSSNGDLDPLPQASVAEVAVADEPPEAPKIESVGRMAFGTPIAAFAASPNAAVAAFSADGTVTLHEFRSSGDHANDLHGDSSPAIAAAWSGDHFYSLEGGPTPALVRWDRVGDTLEARKWHFEGIPVDLWAGPSRFAWILLRNDEGSELLAAELLDGGAVAAEAARFQLGRTPVGFFSGGNNQLVVPCFDERALYKFDHRALEAPSRYELTFRPLHAYSTAELTLAAAANAPVIARIDAAGAISRDVPAPLSLLRTGALGYTGYSASVGRLYHFDQDFQVVAQQDAFDLVMAFAEEWRYGLVLIDAGRSPRLGVLDPTTLELVEDVPLEGRPTWLAFRDGFAIAVSPAEGIVSAWKIRAQPW